MVVSENFHCVRAQANTKQLQNAQLVLGDFEFSIKNYAMLFQSLGNEIRLKILYLLRSEGELCVCDLSDILGVTIQVVSQQLRKLREKELITFNREGQTLYYRLSETHLDFLNLALNFKNQNF